MRVKASTTEIVKNENAIGIIETTKPAIRNLIP
jgi:hypothetical protein